MTPEEREQVVELLRCAADDAPPETLMAVRRFEPDAAVAINGMFGAVPDGNDLVGSERVVWNLAWSVRSEMPEALKYGDTGEYRQCLLEAAALVEEGRWP